MGTYKVDFADGHLIGLQPYEVKADSHMGAAVVFKNDISGMNPDINGIIVTWTVEEYERGKNPTKFNSQQLPAKEEEKMLKRPNQTEYTRNRIAELEHDLKSFAIQLASCDPKQRGGYKAQITRIENDLARHREFLSPVGQVKRIKSAIEFLREVPHLMDKDHYQGFLDMIEEVADELSEKEEL